MKERHEFAPGTIENPIIDSGLSLEEALRANPNFYLSPEVFERQKLLTVVYKSFDGKYHQGQIVVDKELEEDVTHFFRFLLQQNFPVNKAVPVAHGKYGFNDTSSMGDNNSSGFNPRSKTGKPEPSNHAFGRAIDINPRQNPYIRGEVVEPAGAVYNLDEPGTLTALIVDFLKNRGWIWGGDFKDLKDYHHFEKPPK
jgi:peptidoglycan L-alanyl-D-glutamate endopeptidase CwlK